MHRIFPLFFQQHRYLVKELNDVLAHHGLYHAQFTILFLLREQKMMSLTAIWKYLNVEAPTVTRTVTRLEQMGFVQRVIGSDKREKIIELTPFAYEVLPAIIEDVESYERQMLRHLNEQDVEQLEAILNKMKGD